MSIMINENCTQKHESRCHISKDNIKIFVERRDEFDVITGRINLPTIIKRKHGEKSNKIFK